MKLHLSRPDARNRFSAYGPGYVVVNATRYERSLIVLPDQVLEWEPASVDDLTEIIRDNLQIRRESVVQAEEMIADQTRHFLRWLEGRSMVPTITALSGHHDALRIAELERARRMLDAGGSPEQALEALARALTNKFLHAPLAALNGAGEAERLELIALLTRIYQLPEREL